MHRSLFVLGAVILWFAAVLPAHGQAPAPCQFILGFKTLHDLDPSDIGDCVDNQAFAANGDAQQHTTKGLLAWRKADNWTAFTNGYRTWINGPQGLVSRLNTERFPWEHDQQRTAPAALAGPLASFAYTDSGDKTYSNIALPDGLLEAKATCGPCNDNFIVDLVDSKGFEVGLLANEIGISTSATPASLAANTALHVNAGVYSLAVTAFGSWRVELTVLSPLTNPPVPSGPITGHGSSFVPVTLKSGPLTATSMYNGDGNFIVDVLNADGTDAFVSLANRIGTGPDQKTVNVEDAGVYILNVRTTGDWSISLSQ